MRTTHALLIGLALLALVASPALAKKEKKGPKITQKVFFDITIGGKEAGSCHRTLRVCCLRPKWATRPSIRLMR